MANPSQLKSRIGRFIADLREQKDITQGELAEILGTTQSSIARMESGEQNFTTETLAKIGTALNRNLVKFSGDSTDFKIRGGKKLAGQIVINKSKNGAMGLLSASLLNKGKTILHGIPRIEEVFRILEVMESIGINIKWSEQNTLEIQPPKVFELENLNASSASKTRTIIMFIGALAHHFENFKIPHTSGCNLGKRSIAAHIYGLEKLGIKIDVETDYYNINSTYKQAGPVIMFEAGDTPTENVLIASALLPGRTVIKYASSNYMVQDVAYFLESCGVKVEGLGTNTIVVHGVEEINQTVEHWNSEDPIEAMMFIAIALTTHSSFVIKRASIRFLELELEKLSHMKAKFSLSEPYLSQNGKTKLVDITMYESNLTALDDKITCGAYPDINMDNLPFFVPIATQAVGRTLIHDWSYENRAIYFLELNKLRAEIDLADPHRVYVNGPTVFGPAQVVCPPALRPSANILIGMLAAEGVSILRNVYSIRRGYEDIANRLNAMGADIKILT
jgi:UDP-N-acetylglucosamine 1-carboxyvinyltransferase